MSDVEREKNRVKYFPFHLSDRRKNCYTLHLLIEAFETGDNFSYFLVNFLIERPNIGTVSPTIVFLRDSFRDVWCDCISLRHSIFHCLTGQKMKFSIMDFSSKCDQIHRKLRIWSHLLEKSVMKTSFFVQCLSHS